MVDWEKIKIFVKRNNSQAHLAICNTDIFENSIKNGVYGFPHSGTSRMKSFWRSIASMYNIGPLDLVFFYRTNGSIHGCKEIHGPFKINIQRDIPAIYYDLNSKDFPIHIGNNTDCKVRFMFEKITSDIYSIANNFELIKKFETREIWGYRHPAVMNIGAARKKSVTSFTNKQTIILLNLLQDFGVKRFTFENRDLPYQDRINYYNNMDFDDYHFHLNDRFLINNYTNDEAFYYSHIIRAFKYSKCIYRQKLMDDFWAINSSMLSPHGIESFADITVNTLLESIITVHLQNEIDVVTTNKDDSAMMIFEFKKDQITEKSVRQTEHYLDLLSVIFPDKKIFANVIGIGLETDNINTSSRFADNIKLVNLKVLNQSPLQISFSNP
jgi:hypothetical protein